jgi:hypothetical protein
MVDFASSTILFDNAFLALITFVNVQVHNAVVVIEELSYSELFCCLT